MKSLIPTLTEAGASKQEAFILAGVAYCLTRGNHQWRQASPAAGGAWGVSEQWYGPTPATLREQAVQAIRIYRKRNLADFVYSDRVISSIVSVTIRWWRPRPTDVETDRLSKVYSPLARQYVAQVKKSVNKAGFDWWLLIPVVGIAGWLFFKKGK